MSRSSRMAVKARSRQIARRMALLFLPVARPLALRVRTFLSSPQYDIESRLLIQVDLIEARLEARLVEVLAAQRRTEHLVSIGIEEQRRLHVTARTLLEEQTESIESLRSELSLVHGVPESARA